MGNAEHDLERRPVSVLIRDEDVGKVVAHSWMHIPSGSSEEAAGHGWKFKAGEFHQGVEGQVYVMSVESESGERHMSRGSFLRWMDPDDHEGEKTGPAVLYPASPDELEADGFRAGTLKPDLSGSWTIELGS